MDQNSSCQRAQFTFLFMVAIFHLSHDLKFIIEYYVQLHDAIALSCNKFFFTCIYRTLS